MTSTKFVGLFKFLSGYRKFHLNSPKGYSWKIISAQTGPGIASINGECNSLLDGNLAVDVKDVCEACVRLLEERQTAAAQRQQIIGILEELIAQQLKQRVGGVQGMVTGIV